MNILSSTVVFDWSPLIQFQIRSPRRMEEMSSGEVLEVAARLRGLDRERKRIAASRVRSVCGPCAG